MLQTAYIKSFSKGQITIPKKMRNQVGMEDESWLKITVKDSGIFLEPTKKTPDMKSYRKKLLSLNTDWFSYKDWKKESKNMRNEIDDRLQQNNV